MKKYNKTQSSGLRKRSALAMAISIVLAGAANAQIEEIVVTAEKREASVQDTAIAVSAFDEGSLEAAGIEDALDIQFSVPNMVMSKSNFTDANIAIRGVGNSAVGVSADSGAGIHMNGVYMNAPRIFETEFFDVERVEILRGPQGTLYGRNTTAGVLNVITAKPTDEFEGNLSLGLGNYSALKAKGSVNIPITDQIAQRFAGYYLKRDGYVHNLYTDNDIDDRDIYAVRSTTAFQITDTVDATLVFSKMREDDQRSRVAKQQCIKDPDGILGCLPTGLDFEVWNGNGGISAQLAGLIALSTPGVDQYANSINPRDMRQVYADVDPQYFVEDTIASFELNAEFGDLSFTSLTGYHNAYFNAKTDYDWTVPSVAFNYPVVDYFDGTRTYTAFFDSPTDESSNDSEQFSQEFRLSSNYGDGFDFTTGLFAMRYQNENHYYVYFPVGFQYAALSALPVEQSRYDNHSKNYQVDTWALFGEGYFDLDADSKITVGLRYTDESKEADFKTYYLDFASSVADPYRHQENSWQEWTGKLGYDRNLQLGDSGEGLLFATLSRGYKGGGFNPASSTNLFSETFEPEYVNALEVGLKSSLMDRQVQANVSAFYYDYEGLQVSKIIDQTSINENVNAEVLGLEGEFLFAPDEHWLFGLNIAYLNAEIGDFSTFDPADPAQTGSAVGVIDIFGNNFLAADPASSGVEISLDGNKLPNAPEFSVNASVEHTTYFGGAGWNLTSRLQFYWQDDYYSRIFNTQKDTIESWSVIDAMLTLADGNDVWSLQAWVKNIKDDDFVTGHYTGDATSGLYTNLFLLEPRTFGVTVNYNF